MSLAGQLALRLLAICTSADEARFVDATPSTCGPNSLMMAARLVGASISEQECERLIGKLNQKTTLLQLRTAADAIGLCSAAISDRSAPFLAVDPPVPAIVLLKETFTARRQPHFAVVFGVKDGMIQLLDYPYPVQLIEPRQFLRHWGGEALILAENCERIDPIIASVASSERTRRIAYQVLIAACTAATFFAGLLCWRSRFS